MPIAPKSPDEAERLQSLRKSNLLDTPLDQRFERITRMVCKMLDVPVASFSLIDTERQWFKSIQGIHDTESPLCEAMCAYTVLEDDIMIVPDAKFDRRFFDNPRVNGEKANISFYAGCPIRASDGRKIGSLCAVDMLPRDISPEHVAILRDLAAMLEAELKVTELTHTQNRLIAEIGAAQKLALIDPMTRVWNRNGIEEILRREWAEAIRNASPISLVMGDIDHFKKINDTYGHPVGDTVIQETAKRLVATLRTEDAIGRVGGEEFLLILPGCGHENVFDIVERIRASVTQEPIATTSGPINMTMSFGASWIIPATPDQTASLIAKADEALYLSKNGGRNQSRVLVNTNA